MGAPKNPKLRGTCVLQASDSGEYTVTAVNSGGKIFHAVSVNVAGEAPVEEEITVEE